MDIVADAARALKELSDEGIPVIQGWYDDSLNRLHITLWNLGEYDGGHSDDAPEIECASVQVNIWSHEDQIELKKRVKRLMLKAGFYFMEANDQLETDTKIYTNGMRFLAAREIDDDETEE